MNAVAKIDQRPEQPIASDDSRVLMMIVQKMSDDPDFDIDKVVKMIEIKERLDATAAHKAYYADMAEFKKVAPTIIKDRRVFFKGKDGKSDTDYNHASLGNVVESSISALAEYGFSHNWTTKRDGDRIHVTCTLTHRMGHSESETQDGALDSSGNKSNLQAAASTRTFLERYTFLAVAGLATKEQVDDDGNGAREPDAGRHESTPTHLRPEFADWVSKIDGCHTPEDFSAVWKEMSPSIRAALSYYVQRQKEKALGA